jgi:hypothetical protein
MAEATGTDKCWILLGQHFDRKRARGLSQHEAEQEVRRELVQNLIPHRCRDKYGNFVNSPPGFWPVANFDFATSWASASLPPDPLASEITRKWNEIRGAAQRMFRSPATDITEMPPQSHVLRCFVEVLIIEPNGAPISEADVSSGSMVKDAGEREPIQVDEPLQPAGTKSIPTARVARDTAIKNRLDNGERPGETVEWKKFSAQIRKDCDAFIGDPKYEKHKRGFTDDRITRVTRNLMKDI